MAAQAGRLAASVARQLPLLSVAELLAPITHVRLDTVLMQAGLVPRKYARQFCRNWEVREAQADGSLRPIATGATKVDPARVVIDGKPVPYAGVPLHLVMHKPAGVVCTHADDEGDTVYDLLPRAFGLRKPMLSTVGRLDKDATGLLLLTQSGVLNARLTSPARPCAKEYVVSLAAPLSVDGREAAAFAAGTLELADGTIAKPAKLERHATLAHVCRVTLQEGRYHQIRRMFADVGHTVTGIHRVAFGGLRLSALGLGPGEWRLLTREEMTTLLLSSAVNEHERAYAVGVDKRRHGGGGVPAPPAPAAKVTGTEHGQASGDQAEGRPAGELAPRAVSGRDARRARRRASAAAHADAASSGS
jgi:16S rRNA pseudouridine516 synthase